MPKDNQNDKATADSPAAHGSAEWLPIQLAPKDGTRLLLWCGDEVEVGYWSTSSWVQNILPDGTYSKGAWIIYENRSDTIELAPTHWMALPLPPKEKLSHVRTKSMNNLTLEQKTKLAKMLQNQIVIHKATTEKGEDYCYFSWAKNPEHDENCCATLTFREIYETEWDYIVNRIKEEMTKNEKISYCITLDKLTKAGFTFFATLSEQADALIKLKGVK